MAERGQRRSAATGLRRAVTAGAAATGGIVAACVAGWVAGHHLHPPLALVTVAAVGLSVLVVPPLLRQRRLVRALASRCEPTVVAGVSARVGDLGSPAFVAGPWRPAIYCDRGLLRALPPAELRAVLLHEQAHQRAGHAWHALLTAGLEPLLVWSQRGRAWLARAVARREIAADRAALAAGAEPRALAAALLATSGPGPVPVAPFATSTQLRLEALLGDDRLVRAGGVRRAARWHVSWGIGVAAVACAVAVHPLVLAVMPPCC